MNLRVCQGLWVDATDNHHTFRIFCQSFTNHPSLLIYTACHNPRRGFIFYSVVLLNDHENGYKSVHFSDSYFSQNVTKPDFEVGFMNLRVPGLVCGCDR